MAFKLDKDNTGFKTIEEGEYEVFPHVFEKEVARSSGNKMAQFNYIIRDDVDQPHKGQQVRFDNFVETDTALWRVNQASEAAGMDMEKEYEDIYEWAEDFKGRAVRIRVVLTENNKGKVFPEVAEIMESHYGGEYTGEDKGTADPFKDDDAGKPIDIDDDDLPF